MVGAIYRCIENCSRPSDLCDAILSVGDEAVGAGWSLRIMEQALQKVINKLEDDEVTGGLAVILNLYKSVR